MVSQAAPSTGFLPLESGDHLSLAEFMRIYECRPDIKKAELIGGIVYVASPVNFDHGSPFVVMAGWLDRYIDDQPTLVLAAGNTSYYPLGDNHVQPDLAMWDPARNSTYLGDDDRIYGAPDLIIEIARTSASYDLHEKKDLYRRAGVAEYIVWRVDEEKFDWFKLQEGNYVSLTADQTGRIESKVFPGLRLNVERLLGGQRGRALWE